MKLALGIHSAPEGRRISADFTINYLTVWEVVKRDIPKLEKSLKAL